MFYIFEDKLPIFTVNRKNAKNWHTRCARWWNDINIEHTLNTLWTHSDHTLNTLWALSEHTLNTLWSHSEDMPKIWQNLKNMNQSLTDSPTWIQEMLAHLKSVGINNGHSVIYRVIFYAFSSMTYWWFLGDLIFSGARRRTFQIYAILITKGPIVYLQSTIRPVQHPWNRIILKDDIFMLT